MTLAVECWRCELPGHTAAECQRPAVATHQELDARIARHLERWDAGRGLISTAQKTDYIKAEMKAFNNRKAA